MEDPGSVAQGDDSLSRRSFLTGALSLAALPGSAHAVDGRLKFGLTPVFLSNDLDLLDIFQDYLATACATPVELVSRRTYQEITALLVSGQIDAAWVCGFPYVVYRRSLELVGVPIWQGAPTYRSYVIGRRGRAMRRLSDLVGDIHAYSDPDSNSGYLVTRSALLAENIDPQSAFRRSFFTYGHRNVIRSVSSGLAQSGSVDGYVYDVIAETEPALVENLTVLRRSQLFGFPPVAAPVTERVPGRTGAIREALLAMHESPKGRQVLSMLRLDGFTTGDASLFAGIATMVDQLGDRRG